ncbi:MAG: glycosyltransferase [Candidatus Latescibacteria bacterium]|nr:glycosyltransferase [Candidatus Latescibacterota bacterium]NIO55412.1 glycosyltransferase [Candidatus Latescibacterota bacterium]
MFKNKKIVVVMPAYNAEHTLINTYNEVIEQEIVDLIIIVDDVSKDNTVRIAKNLEKVRVFVHEQNKGYGANQKTCYKLALEEKADIVIMVHADYQYTPKLIPAMAGMIASGLYECVLGSRILGGFARQGGMPLWRYISNRVLTLISNLLMGAKLSEYHTGYRAFSRELLESLPLEHNSDDFVFDNQILAEIIWKGKMIAEITCPTIYHTEASSINFIRGVKYGFGCLATSFLFLLCKVGLMKSRLFPRTKET